MEVSRRDFLKLSGLAAAGIAVGGLCGSAPATAAVRGIPGVKDKAVLNDASKCIGCLSCAVACKKANGLAEPYEYSPSTNGSCWTTVKFQEIGEGASATRVNLKVQCMHCTEPSCVAVCPTGAAHKRSDGIVAIDQETCIGCQYCVMACPFGVPGINGATGTVQKCTMCEGRLAEGKPTACSEACPTGAVTFGAYSDLLGAAKQRVAELKAEGFTQAGLYGDTQLGGLKVLYVLPASPTAVGLPADPQLATADVLVKWAAGLVMAGYLVAIPLRNLFGDGPGASGGTGAKGVSNDAA